MSDGVDPAIIAAIATAEEEAEIALLEEEETMTRWMTIALLLCSVSGCAFLQRQEIRIAAQMLTATACAGAKLKLKPAEATQLRETLAACEAALE